MKHLFLDYIKVFLCAAVLWIPSAIRDIFIITIVYFFVENFKQFNGKMTNLKKKVSYYG